MDSKMDTVVETNEGRFCVANNFGDQEMDTKEYQIFAWGLNDKHQLGQSNQEQDLSIQKTGSTSKILVPK